VQETFLKLDSFGREHRLGRVFLAPLDVIIRRDSLRPPPTRRDGHQQCTPLHHYWTTSHRGRSGPGDRNLIAFEHPAPGAGGEAARLPANQCPRSLDCRDARPDSRSPAAFAGTHRPLGPVWPWRPHRLASLARAASHGRRDLPGTVAVKGDGYGMAVLQGNMMTAVAHPHIAFSPGGVAYIKDDIHDHRTLHIQRDQQRPHPMDIDGRPISSTKSRHA
jgi:hypothetical protein